MSNVMWNIHNKMHIDVKMRKKKCLKFKSSNFMENDAKQIDEKNKLMAGVFTAQHIIIAKAPD